MSTFKGPEVVVENLSAEQLYNKLSDLNNLFDESPDTCVLNSLSTRITQKNSNHHDWCCIFNSFTELYFSTTIVRIH